MSWLLSDFALPFPATTMCEPSGKPVYKDTWWRSAEWSASVLWGRRRWIWRLRITSTVSGAPIPKTILRWSLLWWIDTTVFEEIIISYLTRTFIHKCTSIILSFTAIPGKRSYHLEFQSVLYQPTFFLLFQNHLEIWRGMCVWGVSVRVRA